MIQKGHEELLQLYDSISDFRELNYGEKIQKTDVFIIRTTVYFASDYGNGRYSEDHFPHYRKIVKQDDLEDRLI